MSKYFFEADYHEDGCFTLEYWRELAKERDNDIKLEGARIVYGESFFWCVEFHEFGETSEECGRSCIEYSPRNGKNGRCKFHKNTYEGSSEMFMVTKEGKLVKVKEK